MSTYSVHDLSDHLFWDTDRNKLDFERSKSQIIYQVVEYGKMEDWRIIREVYDKETLKEVVTNFRSMDDVTLSFLASFLDLDKTSFRCYTTKRSAQNFWNS